MESLAVSLPSKSLVQEELIDQRLNCAIRMTANNMIDWDNYENKTLYDWAADNYYGYFDFFPETSELISTFFAHQNLSLTWVDSNQSSGYLAEQTGEWTGAIGNVSLRCMRKPTCLHYLGIFVLQPFQF